MFLADIYVLIAATTEQVKAEFLCSPNKCSFEKLLQSVVDT